MSHNTVDSTVAPGTEAVFGGTPRQRPAPAAERKDKEQDQEVRDHYKRVIRRANFTLKRGKPDHCRIEANNLDDFLDWLEEDLTPKQVDTIRALQGQLREVAVDIGREDADVA